MPYYGLHDGGYIVINEDLGAQVGNNVFIINDNYMRNMVSVFQDGNPITIISQHTATNGDPSSDVFKTITLDATTYDEDKSIQISYMPLVTNTGTYPTATQSNINKHNASISDTLKEPTSKYVLKHYPYLDSNIIHSSAFGITNGIYYFKTSESIIYEPIVVFNNGYKLVYGVNYTLSGNNITFIEQIQGSLQIDYYTLADNIGYKIEMFRTDPTNNETTSRITDITSFCKVVT